MGKVTDPAALALYKETLSYWRYRGYIVWKQVAREWLDLELPTYTAELFNELMHEYVASGGEVHQVVERRPEYVAYRFHYDLRLPMSGRRVYIETVLIEDDQPDPTIRVVSIHDE
jgi:hypothetical protein